MQISILCLTRSFVSKFYTFSIKLFLGSAEAVEASTALDEKLETFNKKKKRKVINANEESQTKNTGEFYLFQSILNC